MRRVSAGGVAVALVLGLICFAREAGGAIILIEAPVHHLGDNYSEDVFPEKPEPEGSTWDSQPFDVPLPVAEQAFLVFDLKEASAPDSIALVNGVSIGRVPDMSGVYGWWDDQHMPFSSSLLLPSGNIVGFTSGWIPDYDDYLFRNVRLEVTPTVPEPSTLIVWSLLGASGVTLGWWRRRKRAG